MSGVLLPTERTTKQQPMGFCWNPDCAGDNDRFVFPIKHDGFCCPKCGADSAPLVGVLSLMHQLVADPQGPIVGAYGRRYRMACAKKRDYLALPDNSEGATGDMQFVNCPDCLKQIDQLRVKEIQGITSKSRLFAPLFTG